MQAFFRGYASLMENSPDTISLIDKNGRILFGSSSVTKLLGYAPDELIGKNCLELIHPDDRQYARSLLNEVIDWASGPITWNARIRRKDCVSCWVENTFSKLFEDLYIPVIVLLQREIHDGGDVQEQSITEAEAHSTVAPDAREPLRSISLYTRILSAKKEPDHRK